jgi:hypothetical protein
VGQFREPGIGRVKYAARDAEVMAAYLKSIGGIPPERVRILVDTHALKSDLTEVLEEWLPKHVDPTTVAYVSVTGRGVVEPVTGAVSILPFDSTAMSGASRYSLRRLQESLAKLPIQRAVVMLDLSLELASSAEAVGTIAPLWEQDGGGKDKIMWIIGNRAVQEAHAYDPGQHGLFTYHLLKGFGGTLHVHQEAGAQGSSGAVWQRTGAPLPSRARTGGHGQAAASGTVQIISKSVLRSATFSSPNRLGSLTGPKPGLYHGPIFSSVRVYSGQLPLAGVAQLVEQRFRKPQVVRSIRIAGSIRHIRQALQHGWVRIPVG